MLKDITNMALKIEMLSATPLYSHRPCFSSDYNLQYLHTCVVQLSCLRIMDIIYIMGIRFPFFIISTACIAPWFWFPLFTLSIHKIAESEYEISQMFIGHCALTFTYLRDAAIGTSGMMVHLECCRDNLRIPLHIGTAFDDWQGRLWAQGRCDQAERSNRALQLVVLVSLPW